MNAQLSAKAANRVGLSPRSAKLKTVGSRKSVIGVSFWLTCVGSSFLFSLNRVAATLAVSGPFCSPWGLQSLRHYEVSTHTSPLSNDAFLAIWRAFF